MGKILWKASYSKKIFPLLARIILASTKNDWIFDSFSENSTPGISSAILERRFFVLEQETEFLEMLNARREELNDGKI